MTADNQRMIGATCTGCNQPSSRKLGTVKQQDLGSADKWHNKCYREDQRNKKGN